MNIYVNEYLRNHGINDENDYQTILNMEEKDIPSGEEILNSDKFNNLIISEIKSEKRIVVFGDYDTDGALATVVMTRGLRRVSELLTGSTGHISYYINDRFIDGYGISKTAIDKLLLKNPKLQTIVTVDNGIVAFEAVEYAKSRGLTVIITDHHKSLENVPNADVVVDPSQAGDDYPFKGISGTTVAYKLLLNLFEKNFKDNIQDIKNLVDFVGVSVVSDVMPMLYENRVYVKKALDVMNGKGDQKIRFGWHALLEHLITINKFKKNKKIDETDFGFLFSPIVNAQSRVNGKANITVDMFLSKDTDDIREKAKYMIEINEDRKAMSNQAFEEVNALDHTGKSIIVVRDDSLGEGLIGLLAGKLAEAYNRPTIVLTDSGNGMLKGSARSIDNLDITDNLRKLDNLESIGGHAGAAGLAIKADNFEAFEQQAVELFDTLVPKDLGNDVVADMSIDADDLNIDLIKDFGKLAPFGQDFAFPIFEVKKMPITQTKTMGKDKDHLKIVSGNTDVIIWSGVSDFGKKADNSSTMDVTGIAQINEYMNSESLQIIVTKNTIKFHK